METKNELKTVEEYHAKVSYLREHNSDQKIPSLYKKIRIHEVLHVHIKNIAGNITSLYECYRFFFQKRDITYLALFTEYMNLERFFRIYGHALSTIVSSGTMDVLEFLLDNGLPVNIQIFDHGSMLMHAARHMQRTVFDFLLHKGIDPNLRDSIGQTALFNVVRYCDVGFLDALIIHGCDLHVIGYNDNTVEKSAIWGGNYEIIRRLIDMGISFNVKGGMKQFLQLQCSMGTLLECKPLLDLLREGGLEDLKPDETMNCFNFTRRQVDEILEL